MHCCWATEHYSCAYLDAAGAASKGVWWLLRCWYCSCRTRSERWKRDLQWFVPFSRKEPWLTVIDRQSPTGPSSAGVVHSVKPLAELHTGKGYIKNT